MWNLHPGRTPRKSGSFCLCLKQGARTISAERSRALGQFSWIQPGILYKEKRINEGLHTHTKKDNSRKNHVSFECYTHASSSCFILVYSSLVIVASPSPSLCIFSLGLSKSGFGGAGGIYEQKCRKCITLGYWRKKNWICRHKDKQRLVTGASICLRESCLQESNSLLVQHSPQSQLECHAAK